MEDTTLQIKEHIAKLVSNLINFKKSPNRIYLKTTLIKKSEYCANCFREGEKLLQGSVHKLSPAVFNHYRSKLRETYKELSELIQDKLTDLKMPPKLDLSLALKIVKPFDGSASHLQQYIDSIELLKDYSSDVAEAEILKFMKITLTGAAHGTSDNASTIKEAIDALKNKFAVKLTPRAVENEMNSKRQANKTITDFGAEIETLAAKLAAAHVSQGTFATEAAAANIVETVAVKSFVDGLQNPTTQFLLRARNPTSLNKAISDALECSPDNSKSKIETTLWCNFQQCTRGNHSHWKGNQSNSYRGRSSGYRRGRGYFRGRGNNQRGNHGYFQNDFQNQNRSQSRGNHNNNNNRNSNNRGRQDNRQANVVEENNVEQNEEVNVANLFRE